MIKQELSILAQDGNYAAIAAMDSSIQELGTSFDDLTDAAVSVELEKLSEVPTDSIISAIGRIRANSAELFEAVHITALSILSRIDEAKENEEFSSAEARTALVYPLNLLLQSLPTAGKKRSQFIDWIVNFAAPAVGFNSKLWFTPSAVDRASQSKDSGAIQGAFYLPKGWQGAATAPPGETKIKSKPFNLVSAARSPYYRPRDYKRERVVSSQYEARSVFHVTEGINKQIDSLSKLIGVAPTITDLKAVPVEELDKYKASPQGKAVGIIDSDKVVVERVGQALKTAKLLISVSANSRGAESDDFAYLLDELNSLLIEFKKRHDVIKAKAAVPSIEDKQEDDNENA